jgi:hypothetical protein
MIASSLQPLSNAWSCSSSNLTHATVAVARLCIVVGNGLEGGPTCFGDPMRVICPLDPTRSQKGGQQPFTNRDSPEDRHPIARHQKLWDFSLSGSRVSAASPKRSLSSRVERFPSSIHDCQRRRRADGEARISRRRQNYQTVQERADTHAIALGAMTSSARPRCNGATKPRNGSWPTPFAGQLVATIAATSATSLGCH